ncbi:MAG: methyl-accepting chemotaxis protein [Pseudomonadota bacterium]|nr:methyl-accepting chemotaxis protein [Pseudomonadota bacterium]
MQSSTTQAFYIQADAFFFKLTVALFAVALLLASWHNTWIEAFVVGIPAVLVPFLVSRALPGHRLSRMSFAASLMVFAALQIHQGHGMIEMHFGIFALLAGLLYYRDYMTIIAAAGTIAVHHLLFNYLQESGVGVWVFEVNTGIEIVLLHATFVVVESALLIFLSRKSWEEFVQSIELADIGAHLQKSGVIDLSFQLHNPNSSFGHTFNQFFASVNELVTQAHELSHSISNVSGDFTRTASSVEEGARKQNDETDLIASATLEMTSAMDEINRYSDQAAEAATQANTVAKESDRDISNARAGIEQLESNIKTANSVIEHLDSESNNIGSVLSVIQGIAEQTNLLALNAAIEAARAGEQGRGFAVVADEVRTLASKTHESTEEIQRMIEQLQKGSSEAVSAMETSLSGVVESVTQVGRIDEQLTAIKSSVEAMHTMNQHIARAINEQNTAIGEVNGNLESIRGIGESTLTHSRDTLTKSQSLADMSLRMSELLAKFRTGGQDYYN